MTADPTPEARTTPFSWDAMRDELEELPGGGGLNIAHVAVDRHARENATKIAIRCVAEDGLTHADFDYASLRDQTNRFANALLSIGVGKGDRVFMLLAAPTAALYVTCFGTLKNQSIFCPLPSDITPETIAQCVALEYDNVSSRGGKTILITTARLFETKIAPIRASILKSIDQIIIIGKEAVAAQDEHAIDFASWLEASSPLFTIQKTSPDAEAFHTFVFDDTGTNAPRALKHVHRAVVAHYATARYALDLHSNDVFLSMASPSSVLGIAYGVIAPLVHGATIIVDEAAAAAAATTALATRHSRRDRDAADAVAAGRWYRTLRDERVTVWFADPVAVRMLAGVVSEAPRRFDELRNLRFIARVGEQPLSSIDDANANANVNAIAMVSWGFEAVGLPIHDNWWQPETGAILIASVAAIELRPGSIGKALPGIRAAIVRRDPDGWATVIREHDVEGELALMPGWPSMFRGYVNDESQTRNRFHGGWYVTGVHARRDEDGYFWLSQHAT